MSVPESLVLHIPMWERVNYFKLSMATLVVALKELRAHDPGFYRSLVLHCVDDSRRKDRRLFVDHLVKPLGLSPRLPECHYEAKHPKERVDVHLYGSVLRTAERFPQSWLLNCETDHVYHPGFLLVARDVLRWMNRHREVWLANLYNENTSHHKKSTYGRLRIRSHDFLRRRIVIGASLLISPLLLVTLNRHKIALPPGWGWDWFLSSLNGALKRQIICSRRSWSQHIGLAGANSRRLSVPDIGVHFEN